MWSEDETATLVREWPKASAATIAKQIGCTRNAVIGRVHRLGLTCPNTKPRTQRGWPHDEVAVLRDCWARGLRPGEIANALVAAGYARRQPHAISDKANRLSLPARAALRAAKTVHRSSTRRATYMEKPQPIASLDVPFVEALPGQCRAVTDATRFEQKVCGHPVDEHGVYCAAHRAIFYTPTKARGT